MPLQVGLVLLSSILLLGTPEARADSVCPATPAQAVSAAQQAEDAFAQMNGDGFRLSYALLNEQIGCLTAPPDPSQAAAIHRAEALAAFMAKDVERSRAELQAMHESDPAAALSSAVAPEGGPLHQRDAEARALPPSPRAPHGVELQVVVDGQTARDLPTTRPALVIVLGSDAQPLWSGLVPGGASIPPLVDTHPEFGSSLPSAGSLGPVEKEPLSRAVRPVLVAAGTSAVAAGVLAALYFPARAQTNLAGELIESNASAAEWEQDFPSQLTPDEVIALRDQARAYELGAQISSGLALGLGVVGVGLVIAW